MISSQVNKIQLGLAQTLAAAVYRIYPSALPLQVGAFPQGCFYDFGITNFSNELISSIEKILHTILEKETAIRREMIAKNAASFFRAEKKIHLAKEAESLGNKLIYVFQLHSFFYLSQEDFSLDFSKLYFAVKEYFPRGSFSKKEIPVVRLIAYTAFSKEELRNLLRRYHRSSTRIHHTIGKKLDLFDFQYDQNVEKIIWKEKGTFLFFRLQQFWHRFIRANETLLVEPYPIRKESKVYLNQLERLPVSFSHQYLDYTDNTPSLSPFPNLYSLPFQMKDCSYEFCSQSSLQNRLLIKHKLVESFYDLLEIPYCKKQTKRGSSYFYDSILGKALPLGYVSSNYLNKNISIIEYSLLYSIERIVGVLLEYFGENLPFWLRPIQVSILYEPSQLPRIKKILLNRDITYHLEPIKKKNTNRIKDPNAFYNIFFFKNDEIRIKGQRNEEQKVTFCELDTLLQKLEKKNCPEKLIIG